jgi:hypothetical protein
MNTYFVTESHQGYDEVSIITAETAEAAVLEHAENMGYDADDLEQITFNVYEPKVNVKSYAFDTTPRVVAVKATKGAK